MSLWLCARVFVCIRLYTRVISTVLGCSGVFFVVCCRLRPWLSGDFGDQLMAGGAEIIAEFAHDEESFQHFRPSFLFDFRLFEDDLTDEELFDEMRSIRCWTTRPPRAPPLALQPCNVQSVACEDLRSASFVCILSLSRHSCCPARCLVLHLCLNSCCFLNVYICVAASTPEVQNRRFFSFIHGFRQLDREWTARRMVLDYLKPRLNQFLGDAKDRSLLW